MNQKKISHIILGTLTLALALSACQPSPATPTQFPIAKHTATPTHTPSMPTATYTYMPFNPTTTPIPEVLAPAWGEDMLLYLIFVSSFYDSNADGIGDLPGLTAKLDYLNDGNPATTDDLGVTAIWLMPIFAAASYHGYDTTDHFTIRSSKTLTRIPLQLTPTGSTGTMKPIPTTSPSLILTSSLRSMARARPYVNSHCVWPVTGWIWMEMAT